MSITQSIFSVEALSQQKIDDVEKARCELFDDVDTFSLLLSQESDDTIQRIKNISNRIKEDFSTLIVVGAGASINIPKMLHGFSGNTSLQTYFIERVDAKELQDIFDNNSAKDTCIVAISKSGNTIEVNFLLAKFIEWFRKSLSLSELKTHLYFVTEVDSKLDKFSHSIGTTSIPHPVNIGGRFSVFNTTGLLPAAIFGFHLERLILAGKEAFVNLIKKDSWVIEGVLYNYSMSDLFSESVLVKYDSVFDGAFSWLRQLIAESLGKDKKGVTPIVSDGIVDRHSQLQLFLDGPDNKFFTLFSNKKNKAIFDYKKISASVTESLISDKIIACGIDDFNFKQESALLKTLCKAQKNVRYFVMDSINEESISNFVMGNMLEIMLYAYLRDINPFGQPAIEKFKQELSYLE